MGTKRVASVANSVGLSVIPFGSNTPGCRKNNVICGLVHNESNGSSIDIEPSVTRVLKHIWQKYGDAFLDFSSLFIATGTVVVMVDVAKYIGIALGCAAIDSALRANGIIGCERKPSLASGRANNHEDGNSAKDTKSCPISDQRDRQVEDSQSLESLPRQQDVNEDLLPKSEAVEGGLGDYTERKAWCELSQETAGCCVEEGFEMGFEMGLEMGYGNEYDELLGWDDIYCTNADMIEYEFMQEQTSTPKRLHYTIIHSSSTEQSDREDRYGRVSKSEHPIQKPKFTFPKSSLSSYKHGQRESPKKKTLRKRRRKTKPSELEEEYPRYMSRYCAPFPLHHNDRRMSDILNEGSVTEPSTDNLSSPSSSLSGLSLSVESDDPNTLDGNETRDIETSCDQSYPSEWDTFSGNLSVVRGHSFTSDQTLNHDNLQDSSLGGESIESFVRRRNNSICSKILPSNPGIQVQLGPFPLMHASQLLTTRPYVSFTTSTGLDVSLLREEDLEQFPQEEDVSPVLECSPAEAPKEDSWRLDRDHLAAIASTSMGSLRHLYSNITGWFRQSQQ